MQSNIDGFNKENLHSLLHFTPFETQINWYVDDVSEQLYDTP